MSTSDSKPEPPPDFDSDNRHTVHFYDDGNIMLDVKGMFFQVHKSILKLNSQTFHDMFVLPQVKASADDPVATITLQDDPHTFAKLLDALYKGSLFLTTSSLRQLLEVVELARKYEMVELENTLHGHLEQQLPISTSNPTDSYERFKHYYTDRSLAPLVLRAGSPELIPWALYAFGVYLNSGFKAEDELTYKPPPEIYTVCHTYVYPLIILPHIINHAIKGWNAGASKAFVNQCKAASCARKRGVNLSFSPDPLDPITWINKSWWLPVHSLALNDGVWCRCITSGNDLNRTLSSDIHSQLVKCITQVNGGVAPHNDS